MDAWDRARTHRLTAVVGALPPPPSGVNVIRCRCTPDGPGLTGLVEPLGLRWDALVDAVQRPLAERWLDPGNRPEPYAPLLAALRALPKPADQVVVVQRIDHAPRDVRGLLQVLVAAGDVPVLLVLDDGDPLLARTQDRHGEAAVLRTGRSHAALGELPSEVLHVLIAATIDDGPASLTTLCQRTRRTEFDVLAALQAASVRGVRIEDDGAGQFTIDADLVEELRENTLPTVAAQMAAHEGPVRLPASAQPLQHAREAVALGLWARAARANADAPVLEQAALAWAMWEIDRAHNLLDTLADDADRALRAALWTVRWTEGAFDTLGTVPPPHPLDLAVLAVRRGDRAGARAELEARRRSSSDPLLLHVSAALALQEAAPDLSQAAADIAEALAQCDDPERAARMHDTAARIAHRRGAYDEALAAFERALPQLEATGQTMAMARATAGMVDALATPDDAEEAAHEPRGARDALYWLDRAVRANRTRPDALRWCKAALDGLMQRMPVDPSSSSGASMGRDPIVDLRRISMELSALLSSRR
jgi:tetratricopeptide (TPR) repeat protein